MFQQRSPRTKSPLVATMSKWFSVLIIALVAPIFSSACNPPLINTTAPPGPVPHTVDIPTGAEIGTLRIPINCNVPILGAMEFVINASGGIPTRLGPGQQFYLTNVHGSLEIPQQLQGVGQLVNAASVDARVTRLDINASGSNPGTVNAASPEWDIPGIAIPATPTPMVVRAPADGTKVLGPFTAPNNGWVELSLGELDFEMNLKDSTGATVLFPLDVVCQPPANSPLIAAITVDPTAPTSPAARYDNIDVPDFGQPIGTDTGSLSAPLSCNVGGYGTRTLSAILTAQLPVFLPADESYSLYNATGAVQLPADLVSQLMADHPSATQAEGMITELDINSDNSTPATLNIADPPLAAPAVPLVAGEGIDVGVPDSGTLTVGPWTLGTGPITTMTWGAAAGQVSLLDAQGQQVGSPISISCDPPPGPVTLMRQKVTQGPHPVVTGISPSGGPYIGNSSVTITGTGFTGAIGVNFGLGGAVFSIDSDTQITASTPAGSPGTVDVTVLGPNGPSPITAAAQYTYQ